MGSLYNRYTHVRCECGGIIGICDSRRTFNCGDCNKEFHYYDLDYDILFRNDKTGWIFPMKVKGVKSSDS